MPAQRPGSRGSRGSKLLQHGAGNVLGVSHLSQQDYSEAVQNNAPPTSTQFRGRSNMANGITTKLLRYGTDSEKEDRRKLLEDEKVLHLRAALMMSVSRKPEKIDVGKLKEEINKMESPPTKGDGSDHHPHHHTHTVDTHPKKVNPKKKHHWEEDTSDSKQRQKEWGDKEAPLVRKQHDLERSPEHIHNASHVLPYRSESPLKPNVTELNEERLQHAIELSHISSHVGTELDDDKGGAVAVTSHDNGGGHEDRGTDKDKAVLNKRQPRSAPQGKPPVALGDLKSGLAELKKVSDSNSNSSNNKPAAVALGDLKQGLAGLKKAQKAQPRGGPAGGIALGDLKSGLAGLKKVSDSIKGNNDDNGGSDPKLKERTAAWDKFLQEMDLLLGDFGLLLREMPTLRQPSPKRLGDGKFGTAYLYQTMTTMMTTTTTGSVTSPSSPVRSLNVNSGGGEGGGGDIVLKIASFGDNDPNKAGQKVFRQSNTSEAARKLAPAVLLEEFAREVRCLMALRHPHIMGFLGVLVPPNAPLSLITEYISGGSLGQALADTENWGRVPQKQRMGLLKGVLQGLQYMHSRGFIHRDVKPHNILLAPLSAHDGRYQHSLDDDVTQRWHVAKIADFGTSVLVPHGQRASGEVGTTGYMAPEIGDTRGYDGAVDVFAFGVISWELFCLGGEGVAGEKERETTPTTRNNSSGNSSGNPMIGKDAADLFDGPRPVFNSSHPSSVVVIAKRAWHGNPAKRPTFNAICGLLGVVSSDAAAAAAAV